MKRKLYSSVLMGIMMLIGQAAWADLQQNENGAYLIGSKDDLQLWTEMPGYESTDVVLTSDIEGLDFMLCTNSTSYSGTFDGAGHTITVNYDFNGKQTAMFYNFAGTVKNLVVGGYIKATYKNCAAFAAYNWSDTSLFENCVSIVNIDVDYTANISNGGFVGYTNRSTTFRNCISAIKVKGNQGYNNGFCGWIGNSKTTTYVNCISIEEAETMSTFSWGNPVGALSLTNCYSLQQDADAITPINGCTYITYDQVATGELCFKANGDQSNIHWYQTIGEDPIPLPFAEGHKQVYAVGEVNCAGVAIGEVTYSNDNSSPAPKHNDVDGWCSECGQLMQDHLTPNADGFYELGSAADVEWFAAMVNEAHQTTINGLLTADIDYQGIENAHTPIGLNTTYKYNGIFDGQGHRIKNMIINRASNFQGFFGVLRGGTIVRNLIIDSSCSVTGTTGIGGTEVLQEDEQHQNGEQCAEQQAFQNGSNDVHDVVALVHQQEELQTGIFCFQRVKACLNAFADFCGCIVGLFFKAEHQAGGGAQTSVNVFGVVGDKDVCNIAQIDGFNIVQAEVEEHQILQFFYGCKVITDGYHVIDAILLDVACRHGEVLGIQNLRNGFQTEDIVQICLRQSVLSGGFDGV